MAYGKDSFVRYDVACLEWSVSSQPSRGEMREADMKCKVAAWLLPSPLSHLLVQVAYLLRFLPIAGRLTRSRKLVAECTFRYQSLSAVLHFSQITVLRLDSFS